MGIKIPDYSSIQMIKVFPFDKWCPIGMALNTGPVFKWFLLLAFEYWSDIEMTFENQTKSLMFKW